MEYKTETVYVLKCSPEFFQPLLDGGKTFELRTNERDYATNDLLVLAEYDDCQGFSGRTLFRKVGYVLTGGCFGLPLNLVIISLLPLDAIKEKCLENNFSLHSFLGDA